MEKLLDLKQTAEILGVNYPRAAQLARSGLLPVIRLGRQYRVDPRQLEQFMAGGGKALVSGSPGCREPEPRAIADRRGPAPAPGRARVIRRSSYGVEEAWQGVSYRHERGELARWRYLLLRWAYRALRWVFLRSG